jgi:hypothetical protein
VPVSVAPPIRPANSQLTIVACLARPPVSFSPARCPLPAAGLENEPTGAAGRFWAGPAGQVHSSRSSGSTPYLLGLPTKHRRTWHGAEPPTGGRPSRGQRARIARRGRLVRQVRISSPRCYKQASGGLRGATALSGSMGQGGEYFRSKLWGVAPSGAAAPAASPP